MSLDDLLSAFDDQQNDQVGDESWKEIGGIPKFNHQELLALYAWGFDIPKALIEAILKLPPESLIRDLHLMLEDAQARYADYLEKDTAPDGTPLALSALSFPAHALFLLAELEATESLDFVLDFLSQDPELLDFWMGDLETIHLWPILFRLGKNDLPKLQKFVRNHSAGAFYRTVAINAVGQIAWHYSGRRGEVFSWFETFFEYYSSNSKDESEKELLGDAVSVVSNLRAVDLLDIIEALFNANLVETSVCGALFEVKGDMYEPVNNWAKVQVKNIYSTYSHFTDTLDTYADEEEELPNLVQGGAYLSSKSKKKPMASFNPNAQPVKIGAKTGRNEPCPCGSGLKFKVCHGQ